MLPRTTPNGPFPIQHTFMVQCAAETTPDVTGITGRVEHLVSGHAIRCESVGALFAFTAPRSAVQESSQRRRPQRGIYQTNCEERR